MLTVVLAGCSSFSPKAGHVSDPRSSTALNVVNASGINEGKALQDVSQQNIKQALRAKDGSTSELSIASSALFATGAATALPGFSSMGSAGLALVPVLLPTKRKAFQDSRWIIWMPKDGMTKDQAKERLEGIFSEAISSRFTDLNITPYQGVLNEKRTNAEDIQLQINEPIEAKAPLWLGGYDAYGWGISDDFMGVSQNGSITTILPKSFYQTRGKDLTETREDFLSFTKNMPDWVYYYNAPMGAGYKGAEYPVVFNKGTALFFIKPQNG